MKTLRTLLQVLLTLLWMASAIAILPLGIIGAFTFTGNLFLAAWCCAILLISIPMLSHALNRFLKN